MGYLKFPFFKEVSLELEVLVNTSWLGVILQVWDTDYLYQESYT